MVKFPRPRAAERTAADDAVSADDAAESATASDETRRNGSYTPGKGRPTPRRRDAENRARGPVPPPPRTQREAARRARTERGSRDQRRSEAAERRARMAAGDERYLLPRDKGPVRAYIRDLVDSRRHLLGLLMPLALLVLLSVLTPVPQISAYATPATMVILAIMIVDGIVLAWFVAKKVRTKFPDAPDGAMSIGWYAFVRASQIRKLRLPKPRVQPGAEV